MSFFVGITYVLRRVGHFRHGSSSHEQLSTFEVLVNPMQDLPKEGDPVLGPQVRGQARVDVLRQQLLHLHLNNVQPFRAEIAQNL